MSQGLSLGGRRRIPVGIVALATSVLGIGMAWFIYSCFRIEVPKEHVAILIRKTGLDLKNGDEIAPSPEHKGIQREMLGDGRYFYNPYVWDWEVIPHFQVPDDKFGVKIRLVGDDLDYGQVVAVNETEKGIVEKILQPGRHPYNKYVERIELHEPIVVPAGFLGVVTNLTGPMPTDPNTLLVEAGFRGVQKETLPPGRWMRNPYVQRINLIDCRSQRFNMAEKKDMGFPSEDGFWVRLAGVVEFRVDPKKAAEVYVKFNDDKQGETGSERIDAELVRKVIEPNARSFCRLEGSKSKGREFIQGDTRSLFQGNFEKAMRQACVEEGIEIVQALITNIYPPQVIAKPVREREIAKQSEKQYLQQILQQKSEMSLAVEKETVKQKTQIVQAEQAAVRVTVEATREQEVAVTKAEENLSVAQLKLEAAIDEAAAIAARGKAAAEVVHFQNKAEAAGWQRAVAAFNGDGTQYAQYVLFEKMASAYSNIMVNTADSPIMKIFESFTVPVSPSVPRVTTSKTHPAAAGVPESP